MLLKQAKLAVPTGEELCSVSTISHTQHSYSPEASLAWLGEEGFSASTIYTGPETVWLLFAAICGKWFSCCKIVTTLKKLQFNAKIIYIYFLLYFVQYKFHFCLSKYHCDYFSNFNFFYLNLISTYYCPTRNKINTLLWAFKFVSLISADQIYWAIQCPHTEINELLQ